MKTKFFAITAISFLFGILLAILGINFAMTAGEGKPIEMWQKEGASVIFSLNREFGHPWYWRLTPERNTFLKSLRMELQKNGWTQVRENFPRFEKGTNEQCFLHLYAGGLPNFVVWRETVTEGEYLQGKYQGERYTSYDVKDVEHALQMCK